MRKITHKGVLVGIKVSSLGKGSVPITGDSEPLQMVALKHPKGAYLKAHYHHSTHLVATQVQECLFVRKGRVSLDIYGPKPDHTYLQKVLLKTGDSFILLNGGYGIHMLENCELIEMKNGPYYNDKVLIETKKS